jgi:RimJ/RimL family protein N-acetyltransferase
MFARTDRLLLRPGWFEDAPALAAAIGNEAVAGKLARVPLPYGVAEAQAFLARPQDPLQPDFLIFTRTRGAPRLVGGAGLSRDASGDTELGYWIARDYWGLGFATEAGRAVIALARESLRLPRIVAGHFIDNPASGRVLRKLGFRAAGRYASRPNLARNAILPCALYSLDMAAVAEASPMAA